MDEEDQDYIFYGTPIEIEEEVSGRKRKMAVEAGQMRSLPPWKQEVRDEEGRKRFHGAFTGGFSAGYYNTVGSKEGWSPQTFTSSRKNRAEVKEQTLYNFLDDDEKAELEGHSLGTSLQFDTFGFTAVEIARKQAEKEQSYRPSVIPGPVPDEIVLPANSSIGVKLLLKMGWRHGHSIKDAHTDSLYGARREARKAFLAFSGNEGRPECTEPAKFDSENTVELPPDYNVHVSPITPIFVLHPKQDLHGLGYDPFKNAPEFRERKILHASGAKVSRHKKPVSMRENLFASNSGKYAPGFGIGALEELDIEDEDIYATGFEFEETHLEEVEEPSRLSKDNRQKPDKTDGSLLGFRVASISDYHLERFNPPVVPHDFEPHHSFPVPSGTGSTFAEPPPPEVPPPDDNDLRMMIEGFAAFVARCGKLFEDLSREKNTTNPLFCFLYGGKGHDFYARKLWEEQRRRADQLKPPVDTKSALGKQKMTAESRGSILGEMPLERSSKVCSSSVASHHLQSILSDTFTKPASQIEFSEAAKPFKDDPSKQERFEQFLKDKYQGGLRAYTVGAGNISESERAREKLDFEAAAEKIERGQLNTEHFISSIAPLQSKVHHNEETMTRKKYPQREEYQWRPAPILCKRFDITDPFIGKPPPLPRARSKMDSLLMISDAIHTIKEETVDVSRNSLSTSISELVEASEQITSKEIEIDSSNTSVQRPVDLYKAIFSDDSDNEGENPSPNQVVDPEKKTEVANTTLNRLIAGDFLESLGKELGLEVPPVSFYSKEKVVISDSQEGAKNMKGVKISSEGDCTTVSTEKTSLGSAEDKLEIKDAKIGYPKIVKEGAYLKSTREEMLDKTDGSSYGNRFEGNNPQGKTSSVSMKHKACEVKTVEMSLDVRSRKCSRQHQTRSSSSLSSDSSDCGECQRSSKAKDEKRRSHEGKRRDHVKHDAHRSRGSASRSHRHDTGREYGEDRWENRKSRDRREAVSSRSDTRKKYH